MENSSIYDSFERMWQHILMKFNNYASTEVLNNHAEDKSNPHEVTKDQIGLANVDNTADLDKPISNAAQAALDEKANLEALNNHTSNVENPHGVTAEQVGALPITGGIMENTLTLNGVILTEGIDYGTGDPSDGVPGQLYFKKVM
jgi:hypothetical protein